MPVRIDELTSDVTVEGEHGGTADAAGMPLPHWEQAARVRALQEQLLRDAERTRAEGYGD
jgi:hypothetical protein